MKREPEPQPIHFTKAREVLQLLIAGTDGPGDAMAALAIAVGSLYKAALLVERVPKDADRFWAGFRAHAEALGAEANVSIAGIGKA